MAVQLEAEHVRMLRVAHYLVGRVYNETEAGFAVEDPTTEAEDLIADALKALGVEYEADVPRGRIAGYAAEIAETLQREAAEQLRVVLTVRAERMSTFGCPQCGRRVRVKAAYPFTGWSFVTCRSCRTLWLNGRTVHDERRADELPVGYAQEMTVWRT